MVLSIDLSQVCLSGKFPNKRQIKALLNWDWSFFQSLGRSILFQESKNWMLQKRKKKFSKTVALILIDNARRDAATEEYKDLELVHDGDKNFSIKKVAKDFKLDYSTLSRYLKKFKTAKLHNEAMNVGYSKHKTIFTSEQENILANYVKRSTEIMFGLTTQEVRQLAYHCAVTHKIKIPDSWIKNKKAGVDWFANFLKHNNNLAIRQLEATSLAIWHEQVGAVTSAERGEQVTVAAVVNAQGSVMPHMILFPRDHFIRDSLRGCIGAANGSGWMNEKTFVMFVHHFIKHSKPSPDNFVLLLLDNNSSHFSVEAINLCRDHGMVMLSFPPHCSHRLQPLDLPAFGPFKRQCSSGIDAWLKNNPGKSLTIYDLPKIINQAHLKAVTPANIVSGFSSAGISSFNADPFDDSDFLPAIVTDRPAPGNSPNNLSEEISPTEKRSANTNDQRIQENTSSVTDPQEGTSRTQFSPEASRSFPKASDRKPNCKRRQRRTTAILTRKSV
ncbi:hypothetical protein ILUMI_15024 [Ignelater luminosus]|uniref:DDE-1 domain-containing protein n=1 Tax=Ignelater luminosus TaxID=2038154 RepID=A0A8K0G9H6_IGNLU|nr:hypothetical protein ILUMI_15024 [Ignelater luminosus]